MHGHGCGHRLHIVKGPKLSLRARWLASSRDATGVLCHRFVGDRCIQDGSQQGVCLPDSRRPGRLPDLGMPRADRRGYEIGEPKVAHKRQDRGVEAVPVRLDRPGSQSVPLTVRWDSHASAYARSVTVHRSGSRHVPRLMSASALASHRVASALVLNVSGAPRRRPSGPTYFTRHCPEGSLDTLPKSRLLMVCLSVGPADTGLDTSRLRPDRQLTDRGGA